MKKYMIPLLLLLLVGSGSLVWLYLYSSSTREAAETVSTETELQHAELSALPDVVEIKREGKSIKISLNDIPQYKNYLLNEGDIQAEIARTQFTSLDVPSSNVYAMLKYGCGTKDCSTILVQTNGNKSESLTMPVGILQDYKVSYDWIDHNQFTIETAALETSEFSALKDWFSSENRKTRNVTIQLNVNKHLDEY
ncbi:hypothetical protein [Paenibacillus pabuli]|uniref:hypothetical protein n=1 Tax=Paenibacillus pabuli TaxID=1472 RepID=UPI001FFF3440|nr:hypothetical protein [Paenibacillus pabuli]UPK44912.1 hypothetical protein KET34_05235 [Paenibacillus pabuli]